MLLCEVLFTLVLYLHNFPCVNISKHVYSSIYGFLGRAIMNKAFMDTWYISPRIDVHNFLQDFLS